MGTRMATARPADSSTVEQTPTAKDRKKISPPGSPYPILQFSPVFAPRTLDDLREMEQTTKSEA